MDAPMTPDYTPLRRSFKDIVHFAVMRKFKGRSSSAQDCGVSTLVAQEESQCSTLIEFSTRSVYSDSDPDRSMAFDMENQAPVAWHQSYLSRPALADTITQRPRTIMKVDESDMISPEDRAWGPSKRYKPRDTTPSKSKPHRKAGLFSYREATAITGQAQMLDAEDRAWM